MNPEADAQSDLQRSKFQELEAENSVLRSQLQGREDGGTPKANEADTGNQANVVNAELMVLRQRVRTFLATYNYISYLRLL